MSHWAFDAFSGCLGKPVTQAGIDGLFDGSELLLEVRDHLGYAKFFEHGIALMTEEASFLLGSGADRRLRAQHLISAFHFNSEAVRGYTRYSGELRGGVKIGESIAVVHGKLGPPLKIGGGTFSPLLKRRFPTWHRYAVGQAFFDVQLDDRAETVISAMFFQERARPDR